MFPLDKFSADIVCYQDEVTRRNKATHERGDLLRYSLDARSTYHTRDYSEIYNDINRKALMCAFSSQLRVNAN